MKRFAALTMTLSMLAASAAIAQVTPFSDDFDSGTPAANWDTDSTGTAFGGNGTLTAEASDSDFRGVPVDPPAGAGQGFMGMIENGPTAAQTAWRVVGTETDKDYVIEVDVYVPVVNSADPPDNFLYQMVLFGVSGSGYGRMHFQYNTGSTTDPRIRVQTAYPSFVTPYAANVADIAGIDVTEGWKNVRVEVDNTASTVHVTVDSVELNNGDPIAITQTGFADGGRAGMGMYINGDTVNATNGLNGPRQLYFDNFSISALSNVDDWATYH